MFFCQRIMDVLQYSQAAWLMMEAGRLGGFTIVAAAYPARSCVYESHEHLRLRIDNFTVCSGRARRMAEIYPIQSALRSAMRSLRYNSASGAIVILLRGRVSVNQSSSALTVVSLSQRMGCAVLEKVFCSRQPSTIRGAYYVSRDGTKLI